MLPIFPAQERRFLAEVKGLKVEGYERSPRTGRIQTSAGKKYLREGSSPAVSGTDRGTSRVAIGIRKARSRAAEGSRCARRSALHEGAFRKIALRFLRIVVQCV